MLSNPGQEAKGTGGTTTATTPQQGATSPPAISLPKGGGAIRGIGEKFAANPVTGTGSMSVPIATSPGRSGFGPQLGLSYDSGAGNGPFGFGWSLSLPAITRKTDKGLPRYLDAEESDVFILSGAEDLVPEFKKDDAGEWLIKDGKVVIFDEPRTVDGVTYCVRRYRPRIEGLFARIERWTNEITGEIHWRSITRDNVTTLYGKDNNSRIFDPNDPNLDPDDPQKPPTRVFSWLICQSYDDKGNVIVYGYQAEDDRNVDRGQANERNRVRTANRYLKHIYYGNHTPYFPVLDADAPWPTLPGPGNWFFEVVFDYGKHDPANPRPDDAAAWPRRNDPFSTYRAGFEVRTYRLCQRVLMFHHFENEAGVGKDCLVRSTDFTYSYEQNPADARNPIYSFLLAVTQTGYKRVNGGYLKRSLPPLEFEYSQPIVQDTVQEVDAESLENLPIGVDGAAYQWTDLHGEGIPGILAEQAGAWFYKRNLSPISERPVEFAPLERVATKPNLALSGGAQFMDLAGDGQPDLVVLDGPTPGLYEHDGDEGWQPFRPFTARLNRDTRDPNLKFVDLDGNGHPDVLITEDDSFAWHASLAEEGFGPARRVAQALDEEKGPRLVFADGTQSIYLADLSGDGLPDLARVRNGEVCYWPNLGYGRFGAKVTMDHAPQFDNPEQFDQNRVRLADIDGSGTTDVIYLHRDGVRLYFNQSGNSWSRPQVLNVFPRVDDLVSIVPTDLLGNGTACLVWSSPLPGDGRRPMRYVDLMGGQKPHLLLKTINNLGAETRVRYAPSTKFYLQDKRAGNPWLTRLPFPVHVVERVETYVHISRNRFVTRYAYHHGYFDGVEREFRGFGLVEQWDTERYATLEADGMLKDAENLDEASHVPPVLTRTWFHTGIYLGHDHVSDFFADIGKGDGEYYREPALRADDAPHDLAAEALLLPDTVLPPDLTLDKEREACRALKGMMLRQEVYALDGTDKEEHPYTVTEQNFTIRRLQPHDGNRHAVFFTHARETINYHYERNPADPRIGHALTLEVDEYGNVLKSASIAYGRRTDSADVELSSEDRKKQRLIHITCTENTFTKPYVAGIGAPDPVGSVAIDEADAYCTPLPAESRTYELRQAQQGESAPEQIRLFQFNDVLANVIQAGDGEHDVSYEDLEFARARQVVTDDPGQREKYFRRLIEYVRTLYRPNRMGVDENDPLALLPLGTVQSLALPGESYKLAFTPGLLQLYGDKIDLADLEQILRDPADGGYVDLDANGHWWIPSGRVFYHPAPDVSADDELAEARAHFFLPRRFRDPFGSNTIVHYDGPADSSLPLYGLLVTRTVDALANEVRAKNDYRVLQPRLVTDPNGNRSEAAFDPLGLVVGTAVMGKPGENLGDSLADFRSDLTQAQIDEFFASCEVSTHRRIGRWS